MGSLCESILDQILGWKIKRIILRIPDIRCSLITVSEDFESTLVKGSGLRISKDVDIQSYGSLETSLLGRE